MSLADLAGAWAFDATVSENAEEVLRLQGVGWAKRKIAVNMTSITQTIAIDGNKLHIKMESAVKTDEQDVIVDGNEYDRVIDETPTKVKANWENGRLIAHHTFVNGDGKKAVRTIERYVEDGGKVLIQNIHIKLTESGEEAKVKRVFRK